MTRFKKLAFLVLWLVFATHVYAYMWSNNLDSFPQLPESVGILISKLTGVYDTENAELATIYYMLIVSFVIVALATCVAMLIVLTLQKFKKPQH